jgi:membrane protein DedA with SNARE-associated domain
VTEFLDDYGLYFLFVVIALESFGLPLPGETSLVLASVAASQGHYDIVAVIAVAASAAIVGDNLGYWTGRTGGRALIARWSLLRRWTDRVLPPAERFFARHGGKTIFIARFVTVLRVTAAWMAGVSRMDWWRFLFWNATGGIAWAVGYGLASYYAGKAVADAIAHYGAIGGGILVGLVVLAVVAVAVYRRRLERRIE